MELEQCKETNMNTITAIVYKTVEIVTQLRVMLAKKILFISDLITEVDPQKPSEIVKAHTFFLES